MASVPPATSVPASLAQVVNPPLGVTGVTNPVPAQGGADPEPPDDARAGIPMAVRTLGRAVSLSDYADYARTFAGIARARADVLVLPGGRTIVVSVAGPDDTVVPDTVLGRLAASLVGHGDPLAQVRVVAHRPEKFRLALRVAVDPDRDTGTVLSGVDSALRAAFGFAAMDFGEPVHRSGVLRAAHTVPGVVAVDLDRLYRPSLLGPHLRNRLVPAPATVTAGGDGPRCRAAHPGRSNAGLAGGAEPVNSDQLYALLPAVYRLRDAEGDGALRELLDVVAGQLEVLQDSIDQFYDDQFVETCADWVVPYIGDLVGYRPLHGVVASVASPRAEVANTIAYRRRKGTAAMLEQLARDVTGWPARAVEFFERLDRHAVHEPLPARQGRHPGPAPARGARVRSAHAASTTCRTPPRCAGSSPVPAGTTSRTWGCSCGGSRPFPLVRVPLTPVGRRSPVPVRPARARRARLRSTVHRGRDHALAVAGRRSTAAVPPVPRRTISTPTTAPRTGSCSRCPGDAIRDRPDLRPVRRRRYLGTPAAPGSSGARPGARSRLVRYRARQPARSARTTTAARCSSAPAATTGATRSTAAWCRPR